MKKKLKIFDFLFLTLLFLLGLSISVKSTDALLSDEINVESPEKDIVDTYTFNKYKNIINENNIGKVWTDKSVFNDDINLDNNVIKKEEDETFLVSLSALSVGIDLNIKEGNVKDIVILQDASGSMSSNKVGSITRLQASKNAINELLEIITKANNSLSSDDEKFCLSLITFAGKSAAKVVFDLTEVNNSNLLELQEKVNSITTSSDTYISSGLDLSLQQILTNGRKNVASSIITFLDGLPYPESDGKTTIALANSIKNEHNVVMYSVVMNADAKGGVSTSIDKIGQGISSNYDNATSPSSLGEQTGNTYYYIPKTADDLIDSFKDIIRTIQKKVYTLEKGSNLTFTDKLGDYMEVKHIKALSYNGKIYTKAAKTTEGNITTYTFNNTVTDALGNSSNINSIKIKVIKSDQAKEGDTISVTIPYNLVPLAIYNVKSIFKTDSTVYTTSLKEAKPISLIYSSNVKNEVFDLYRANDLNIKEYINKNGYLKDYEGKAYFYSNYFENGVSGTTEVNFKPFNRNSYYYYEDESYLYIKTEEGYSLYSGSDLKDETYYIKKTVYKEGTELARVESYEEVKTVKEAVKDNENHWYFTDDSKKEINNSIVKEKNETKTALNESDTSWNDKDIKTLLGNNGITLVEMDVERIDIKINKVWDDSNNQSGKRPKSISIRLKRNGEDLGEAYKVNLSEENNWSYTYENLPLKIDGEEVTYTIEEEKIENYSIRIEGSQETGFTITNSIIIENPYTGFKTAITVIALSLMLTFVCYYFKDKRNKLYKI